MSVQASHLLIKHQGSRRPASWKDESGAEITKRTKDDAIKTLMAHRDVIMADANPAQKFGELAAIHSDCSSAKQKGDLGPFQRGQMQKPFEDATFALQVGQISEMVDTDSGVHIILRTA
mmetsp:Transcript_37121/g.87010  ORF Transcript_37121/g.87010 Transcript_37121/m.87010 type:complete len:119 (-) Transcript_37121:532-888(-)|eukprot:CAMPEP_0172024908 /NCGR_PEP_ID=MMETSP1041-20130122/15604_1 /TAXON_ID=464988 /ORGANISM="Hemiselmis andersenii, Strain CCMP439" /LENGTH=118 /DNA_ID=CAMNT_0012680547 /DNA_START=12 /DNA_END=368 /DNA_ORIENTATION=+